MTADMRCLSHEIRRCTICLPPVDPLPQRGVWHLRGGVEGVSYEVDGTVWSVCLNDVGGATAKRHHDGAVRVWGARTLRTNRGT